MSENKDGVQLVSSAILGIDFEPVMIGGKVYQIYPPTIRKFVGAISCMKEVKGDSFLDIIMGMDLVGSCEALSWFIKGDGSLKEMFLDCPLSEVQDGLIKALGLVDPQNFIRLSALQRNVRRLIARQR